MTRTALITGASKGIGAETARCLARQRWDLVLVARTAELLTEVARECQQLGAQRARTIAVDLTSPMGPSMVAREIANTPVDLIFHNAGTAHAVPLAETSDELWNSTVEINLTAPFRLTRELLPHLNSQGQIIYNASVAAKRNFPNFSAYTAAKAGLVAMAGCLREELRARGTRVTVLLPGATDTDIWESIGGQWNRAAMMRASAVADSVAYIASLPAEATIEEIVIMPSGGAL